MLQLKGNSCQILIQNIELVIKNKYMSLVEFRVCNILKISKGLLT